MRSVPLASVDARATTPLRSKHPRVVSRTLRPESVKKGVHVLLQLRTRRLCETTRQRTTRQGDVTITFLLILLILLLLVTILFITIMTVTIVASIIIIITIIIFMLFASFLRLPLVVAVLV